MLTAALHSEIEKATSLGLQSRSRLEDRLARYPAHSSSTASGTVD